MGSTYKGCHYLAKHGVDDIVHGGIVWMMVVDGGMESGRISPSTDNLRS